MNRETITDACMHRRILVALTFLVPFADAKPVYLRVEHMENPLGIDVPQPRFSWRTDTVERNWHQAAFPVLVASMSSKLKAPYIWDSAKQTSSDSVGIAYAGPALESHKRYHWVVRT